MRPSAFPVWPHARVPLLAIAGALPLVAGLIVGLGAAPASRAAQPAPAARLLRAALADAAARGSGHQAVSERAGGSSATLSDDVATHDGRQDIAFSDGGRAQVLVLRDAAYLSGNQPALVNHFGFTATQAQEIGAGWVRVPSSNHAYAAIAAAVTLPSVLTEITPAGPLTETAPTHEDGVSVVGIRGRAPALYLQPGTLTVYLTRSGQPLPMLVTVTLRATKHAPAGSETITLSDWGERVAVTAPSDVIAG
jgi:hypothetical protein